MKAGHSCLDHLGTTFTLEFLVAWEAIAHRVALRTRPGPQGRVSLLGTIADLSGPIKHLVSMMPSGLIETYDNDISVFELGLVRASFLQISQDVGGPLWQASAPAGPAVARSKL